MSYIDHSKNNTKVRIDPDQHDTSSELTNVSDEQIIKQYISNIVPEIHFNNASSSILRQIFESADTARQKTHLIRQIDSSVIKPIHTRDSYPLCYLFFNLLKETELLDRIVSFTPDLSDLPTFLQWHRDPNSFDNQDIRIIMNDVMRNDSSDPNIIALIELYKLMFEPSEKDLRRSRCALHRSIYNNRYISADVQADLESTELIYTKYLINNRHHIDVFVPINTQGPDMEVVATLIDTVMNLSASVNRHSVNLTIIYSNQKKLVYPKTSSLSADNINSGSTYPTKSIVCWRREEFYKVLIHELFHYYEFDCHHNKNDSFYDDLDETIKLPKLAEGSIDSLNEAYTETMAILILSIVHYTNDQYFNAESKQDRMEYVTKMIKQELAFVMFQVAKILVIFGATSFDQYVAKQKSIEIYQLTSFRSYFVIKMLLLFNLDNLLNLIDNNGIEIKDEKVLGYGDLINDSWDKFIISKNMIKIINKYMIDIIDAFDKKNPNRIYKTCRMCVNDLISFKQ
jgi:hypothetical protein